MAEVFSRKPVPGGDLDAWAVYNDTEHLRTYGQMSSYLKNDAGALKLTPGELGIDNGTVKGTISITADKTISIAALTNDLWAKVEASVSGAVVTIEITSMVGESDEATIPASIKAAYDGSKGGYYLAATKRLLGCTFIKTAALGRIINCENGKLGFQGIECIDYVDSAGAVSKVYHAKKVIEIGDWNMATTTSVNVSHGIAFAAASLKKVRDIRATIRIDTDAAIMNLDRVSDAADPKLAWGAVDSMTTTVITLLRRTGSDFDAVAFQTTPFNRGYVYLEWET